MIRLLVTGASGFVGSNFLKLDTGFVITKVSLSHKKVKNIDFRGIDTVLHLSALVHQKKGIPDDQYFIINRDLTYELAVKAKSQGVKHFVFMSTSKVYGELTNGLPWDENYFCSPVDTYGKSKYEAELKLNNLQNEEFKVAMVRSPLIYGPGVSANMLKLVESVNRYRILPFGSIDNRRSLVYIGNLTALLKRIIEIRAAGIFLAGDEQPLSTTQLVRMIALVSHKNPLLVKVPSPLLYLGKLIKPALVNKLYGSAELDTAHTNDTLGFNLPYSTMDGITELVKWYKNITYPGFI